MGLTKPINLIIKELKTLKRHIYAEDSSFLSKGEIQATKQRIRNNVIQLKQYKLDYKKYGKYRNKLMIKLTELYRKAKWRGDRPIPNWNMYYTKELLIHYKNIKNKGLKFIA